MPEPMSGVGTPIVLKEVNKDRKNCALAPLAANLNARFESVSRSAACSRNGKGNRHGKAEFTQWDERNGEPIPAGSYKSVMFPPGETYLKALQWLKDVSVRVECRGVMP